MRLTEFQSAFGPSIRAMLDWDRLHQAHAFVEVQTLDSRAALGSLLTVWYADEVTGAEATYRDRGAVPLTVRQVAEMVADWGGERLDRVEQFAADMRAGVREGEPLLLTLPAYALPDRARLLDSTHRAVAAYQTGLEVRALLLVLHGPHTADVMPDMQRLLPST
jgi:hypothetical protein